MPAKKKNKICITCGELVAKGLITEEGKNFCCMNCCEEFKSKKVCRFC